VVDLCLSASTSYGLRKSRRDRAGESGLDHRSYDAATRFGSSPRNASSPKRNGRVGRIVPSIRPPIHPHLWNASTRAAEPASLTGRSGRRDSGTVRTSVLGMRFLAAAGARTELIESHPSPDSSTFCVTPSRAGDDPTLEDHDRPLAPRGRKNRRRLAKHFRRGGDATPAGLVLFGRPELKTRHCADLGQRWPV